MAGEIGEAAFNPAAGDDGSTPPPTVGGFVQDPVGTLAGLAGDAAGAQNAVTGLIGGLIAPINTWIANIESGFAHFINVILNNVFYAGIALIGVFLMLGGFYLLVFATPAGKEVAGLVSKAASVAV